MATNNSRTSGKKTGSQGSQGQAPAPPASRSGVSQAAEQKLQFTVAPKAVADAMATGATSARAIRVTPSPSEVLSDVQLDPGILEELERARRRAEEAEARANDAANLTAPEWLKVREVIAEALKRGGSSQHIGTRRQVAENLLAYGYIDVRAIVNELHEKEDAERRAAAEATANAAVKADVEKAMGHG